jgi:hypothetical protein
VNSSDIYAPEHWDNICKLVVARSRVTLPLVVLRRVKSTLVSHFFEICAAEYFNSIGIQCQNALTDKQPDLKFGEDICEIKTTNVYNNPISRKITWTGNVISKVDSTYMFIMWHLSDKQTLFPKTMDFFLAKCYVDQTEWGTLGNYNGAGFTTDDLISRDFEVIVGENEGRNFKLKSFDYDTI